MFMREDGTWTYASPVQVLIWQTMIEHTGWDITGFDHWIYWSNCWKGYPVARLRLISARNNLTLDCERVNTTGKDDMQQIATKYLLDTYQVSLRCKLLPSDLKTQMVAARRELQSKSEST